MSKLAELGIGLGMVAATWLPSAPAHACTGSFCKPDAFLPFEGSVPASVPGIQWWRGRREGVVEGESLHVTQPEDLRFRCGANASSMRDIAFHIEGNDDVALIIPDASLVVGEQCEVTLVDRLQACPLGSAPNGGLLPHQRERADFTVTPAIDPPTTLGTLVVEPAAVQDTMLATHAASCRVDVPVCGVAVRMQLASATAPWADALLFRTLVDGQPWAVQGHLNASNPTGGSFIGRGEDLVFLAADDTEGFGLSSAGPHTIQMVADLVGTDLDLLPMTEPVTVTIDCAANTEPDAGERTDASLTVDAGTQSDAALDTPTQRGKGGGCSVADTRGAQTRKPWLLWPVVLVGLVACRIRSNRAASRARATRA